MPTPYARKLLPLCNELSDAAFKIAGQADVKITENTPLEPKFLALALSVSAIVNEMCGNTAAGELLPELNARFQTLQTGRFGINDICQGLEK